MSGETEEDKRDKPIKDIIQDVLNQYNKTQEENKQQDKERIRRQIEQDKDKILPSMTKMRTASKDHKDDESSDKKS
jgi:hypothetical protein